MGVALTILDERRSWIEPLYSAAKARGYDAQSVTRAKYARSRGGLVFFRPHAHPQVLKMNREADWPVFRNGKGFTCIQDDAQIMCYDNKSEQFRRWSKFMPRTWRFDNMLDALAHVENWNKPLVFKSDVGASSTNVRIVEHIHDQRKYVERVFKHGIDQNHCCGGGGGKSVVTTQRDYVLCQEVIPHEATWRVNAVGNLRAIFKRKNYPDRMVAQTGNVEPIMTDQDQWTQELLGFADEVFAEIGSKWCALDILWDPKQARYVLLETSLAWPWPSPGECMSAPFFGSTRTWEHMWDAMLDQYEMGVWG